jgi:mevalonate kinase
MSSVDLVREWSREELCLLLDLLPEKTSPSPPSDEFIKTLEEKHNLSLSDTSPATLASIGFLHLLTYILRQRFRSCPGLRFVLVSNLPVSAGLGSSATFAVCMAAGIHLLLQRFTAESPYNTGAPVNNILKNEISVFPEAVVKCLRECNCNKMFKEVDKYACIELDIERKFVVNLWAVECERLIHGTPSGIDNTTSCFGGIISYTGGITRNLDRCPPLRILLSHTNIPRSTKLMVSEVRRRRDKYPQVVEPVLQSIHSISESCEEVLSEFSGSELDEDTAKYLGELIEINQQLLNSIGVGHPTFDLICKITKEFGFYSKLTGAGGGGCAITLIAPGPNLKERIDRCIAMLAEQGFVSWETELGCCGVASHSIV